MCCCSTSTTWLAVRLIAQALVGLLYLLALVRLWQSQEEAALNTAIFAALLSFTIVNLLDFYLNQFRALSDFTFHLAVFALLVAYRAGHLVPSSEDE